MPTRKGPNLLLLCTLLALAAMAPARGVRGAPTRPGLEAAAALLADSLLARVPRVESRVLEAEQGRGRLGAGSSAGIERRASLTLTSPGEHGAGLPPEAVLGEVDIESLEEGTLTFKPSAGAPAARVTAGQTVRAFLERHTLALAVPGTTALSAGGTGRLMAALRLHLNTPVMRLIVMPGLSDTVEAQQMARAGGADLYGWVLVRRSGTDLTVSLALFRAKDNRALPPLGVRVPADDPALAPARAAAGEDPAASLPGCRPFWRSDPIPGPVLEIFPRRFNAGAVDFFFSDRIEGWRLNAQGMDRWQSYPLDDLWPPVVGTRWPLAALLPVNSYYDKGRQESRVFYALCSNQRPRYLAINVQRERPDSLNLSVSEGPQDSLKACTASCFAQVDRVERSARFQPPKDLPKTAGSRLALGRVDVGPSGLPAYDEQGRVKTRSSALLYYDLPSATLWLAGADSAFRVPGHFGDEIDNFRVGKTGPPGFLVTSSAPAGQPDRLQFWVWDDGALTLRWQSDPFEGSITALQVFDMDGDGRDDVLIGESMGSGARARTRCRLYLAALESAAGPR